uniref:Large ribosomal subunit protein bL19c n=1 Tax=Polysiphonia urceolata TaxID=173545 RepID=A0A1Z1MCD5_POLUR|nr:ribosomal protein L19 [Polysiphonia stricta]ARW63599.1 ribosomal protein L19 [Polysiphonia stricta]
MIRKIKQSIDIIYEVEKDYLKNDLPLIEIGDTIKIRKMIQEGVKERIQISEGVVISKNNYNINQTITMRKTIQNIGVERVYLLHSPHIISIEILKKAKVRRSKLYYLRNRSGKATRLKQRLN